MKLAVFTLCYGKVFSVIAAPTVEGNGQVWTTQNAQLGASLGQLFRLNLDEAVEIVLDADRERREEASVGFKDWLERIKKKEAKAKRKLVRIFK